MGKTPQFLAHNLIKFVALGSEKYTEEDDGFGGFGDQLQIIKSRTNQAGIAFNMIYDKKRGMDSLRSSVRFAKEELGVVGGNKNGYYFTDAKDHKFTLKNMHEDFKNDKELYKIMYNNIIPVLESKLSSVTPEELMIPDEEFDY